MSDYTMFVSVICPLCGFNNELNLESGRRMILCDPDLGGCDEYFGLRLGFVADVTTYKLVEATSPAAVSAPLCPIHHAPMTPDTEGDWYCPRFADDPTSGSGEYCDQFKYNEYKVSKND